MDVENVVIAGSGPAGYTAAIYCARANLKPLIVEGAQPYGQLTTTTDIENYPGFPEGINGVELVMKMREQAERFGARVIGGEVVRSDFQKRPFSLILDSGAAHQAHAVIIATGASAIYMGLESEQKLMGRGVSGCAVCDGALYRKAPVVVVGGGDTAMEDALFLTRFASRVTLVHRRDQFRASKIMADRVLQHSLIDVRWNSVVEEVLDVAKGEVTGVRLKDVKTGALTEVPAKGLFLAIGHRPNTGAFGGQVAMDDKGYLIAPQTHTSVPGVFAAGDVQDHVYQQAVTAAGTGCMAALEVERYLAGSRL